MRIPARRRARPLFVVASTLVLLISSIVAAGAALATAPSTQGGHPSTNGAQCNDIETAVDWYTYAFNGFSYGPFTNEDAGDPIAQEGLITIPNDVLQAADVFKVHVQLNAGCDPVELTFASYTASGPSWETSVPQDDFSQDTGFFTGTADLQIAVPDCFYQIDFAYGPYIEAATINANFPDASYGDAKIDWVNGGTGCDSSPSASESASPSASASGSPSPSASESESPGESHSPSPSASESESPSPSASESESPSPSESESPGGSESPSPSASESESPGGSIDSLPSPTGGTLGGGGLPNTSAGDPFTVPVWIFALLMIASLGSLLYLKLTAVRAADR